MQLSSWLRQAAAHAVDRERRGIPAGESAAMKEVFSLLSGALIRDACMVCVYLARDVRRIVSVEGVAFLHLRTR